MTDALIRKVREALTRDDLDPTDDECRAAIVAVLDYVESEVKHQGRSTNNVIDSLLSRYREGSA